MHWLLDISGDEAGCIAEAAPRDWVTTRYFDDDSRRTYNVIGQWNVSWLNSISDTRICERVEVIIMVSLPAPLLTHSPFNISNRLGQEPATIPLLHLVSEKPCLKAF